MVQQLHDLNFKVVLHIVVEGRQLMTGQCTIHARPRRSPADARRTAAGLPTARCSCYWPVHKPLLDLGIDGWWPDQGDGFDASVAAAAQSDVFRRSPDVPAQ